jgi:hypothetical protein
MSNKYLGDNKSQLKHGKGVYYYANKFFRYEGEWHNGVKHGHGKLIMGDGSYYEGSFINGEIEGHGYRTFSGDRATYTGKEPLRIYVYRELIMTINLITGQFHRGEFHGQGLYQSSDGLVYEGNWERNKREGQGLLTDSNGDVYEGEFHCHKKHGEGTMIYSNGDKYEGGWIDDMRHGHGMLSCIDNTLYEGQWRGDMYHGEGTMVHGSGVTYKGMWINGHPQSDNPCFLLSHYNNYS